MISYSRDTQQSIPSSAVKIVGLGGAGANMLERIALDGLEGAEFLALNTDIRTLGACLAKEKVQLGVNLTKGLGTGGDPELGQQAVLEAENEIREALKGQSIVFLCTGLGGGTGSGAAPIVSRIAREEGAFVVVFATMPFFFEGRRRREQAETALNQLAVLSNALVTFDNNRMGELVLAKQGVHEAFAAADRMISESIKAVIRLVIRPGLINVGLDDLMSALRTTRSRCLFGSGIADGKDRASKALRNALSSPLLDQGSLLKEAQTVLVHLSGGESLTLFEIELLMRSLQKHVPEKAHVLFGAAIDPAMGDNLSITLISALPEDALTTARDSLSFPEAALEAPQIDVANHEIQSPFTKIDTKQDVKAEIAPEPDSFDEDPDEATDAATDAATEEATDAATDAATDEATDEDLPPDEDTNQSIPEPHTKVTLDLGKEIPSLFDDSEPEALEETPEETPATPEPEAEEKEERPFAEFTIAQSNGDASEPEDELDEWKNSTREKEETALSAEEEEAPKKQVYTAAAPKIRSTKKTLWGRSDKTKQQKSSEADPFDDDFIEDSEPTSNAALTELKLDPKNSGNQSELAFDSAPKGRFEGENPNVFEGEDLDLPPFLRKKKS